MLRSRTADFGASAAICAAALMLAAPSAKAIDDPKGPPAVTNPAPATGPLVGRPETSGAQALAPVASPALVTPADKLPIDKIKLPDGFKIEVFASGIKDARTIRIGDKGTVFVSNWQGNKIWAITEKDGKRTAKAIYEGLDWPNGIALHNGTLYVAEHTKISKAENIEASLDSPPKLVTIYDKLGEPRPHGWRFLGVGPDEKLYVSNSAPCNICMPDPGFGEIRKMNLDGSGVEVVLRGMRNTVGFDWNPKTKELYFTDNNRDWFSEDLPNCELNRVSNPGKEHFGFPYCHQGDIADPEFGWGYSCKDFTPPIAKLGPHAAPLGMRFYNATAFPDKYQGAIFIARHGPWNRTIKYGGDILAVYLDDKGNFKGMEPFMEGLVQDNKYIGRPVDVAVMKDGSLLVSDDWNGAVYRVSYAK
ncbi:MULTISPECIES: PQQ-dependent sugar dehydrogenase [Rhodomicrobium]|uniref:PQQ-dependent sugar dehydrogenase n=1 Tax=Rhodomicrobium TaxID=1068 RepID=UPI001FD8CAA9|nr:MULTISPECIES: PQQ-dependent sugar dehydrogenase [Rhodomicrobium]